jgi:hypothetical protein
MSRTTVITHPDGTQTTIRDTGGCGSGCSGCLWALLALFVVALPATWPLPWEIVGYALVGVLGVAAIVGWLQRSGQRRPPIAPPPLPS